MEDGHKQRPLDVDKGDLRGIIRARTFATVRNMRYNSLFTALYETFGLPIATSVLDSAFGLVPSPIIKAFALNLFSISLVGNALRWIRGEGA